MSFDDDFDEVFDGTHIFDSKSMKRVQDRLNKMIDDIKKGRIGGDWEIEQIDQPGIKGYAIRGHFSMKEPLEPLQPLKPLRRRPTPETPFEVRKHALEKKRDLITDIFEEEDAIRVYAELPGEEKDDIKLNIKDGSIEIKTKNFCKRIELPNKNVATEAVTSQYKNGVLEVRIPKRKQLRAEDLHKTRMV
jgi:HSP20 family molecular chaperone IbpA